MQRTAALLCAVAFLAGCGDEDETFSAEEACGEIVGAYCEKALPCRESTQACNRNRQSLIDRCAAIYPRRQGITPAEVTSCRRRVSELDCPTFCSRVVSVAQCGLDDLLSTITCAGAIYDGGPG